MSEQTSPPEGASEHFQLPDAPSLDWLRKRAKRDLEELRRTNPSAKLADAQFNLAKRYGFSSWRALKAYVDSLTVEGQLFEAARKGDVDKLGTLLDAHPDKLTARAKPYEHTLLHLAANHVAAIDLLLKRGLDANARESGDNTYAMHWAAAAGNLDVVRRLADAGGDVIGHGDDHEVEVIGWASCWDGTDDAAHHAVVDFLLTRGARHHIFSAIAMNLADEVRRIVASDPSALNKRMSRNESNQTPLDFAVRMKRPEMVSLLLELGADPLAVDSSGNTAAVYAESPDIDQRVMEKIAQLTAAELDSANRGHRRTSAGMMDLLATISLRDWDTADRLVRDNPDVLNSGALHIATKRGDAPAVKWLLKHGADVNARWAHWDADVTPLHLAALADHPEIALLLLDAGADPRIRDTKHDSDVLGWAEFFGRVEIVRMLQARAAKGS